MLKLSTRQRTVAEFFYTDFGNVSVISVHFRNEVARVARRFAAFIELQTYTRRRREIMKTTKLVMLVMTIAVGLFILIPNLSWAADDGATIYKAKCAMCHGADAAGKPAMKAPSLIGDEAKKKSDDDLGKAIKIGRASC